MNFDNCTFLKGRIINLDIKDINSSVLAKVVLAVPRIGNIKDDDQKDDLIDLEIWGKSAELIRKYSGVGKRIQVFGEVRKDKYEVNGQKKYKNYIKVDSLKIIDWNQKVNKSNDELDEVTEDELEGLIFQEFEGEVDE